MVLFLKYSPPIPLPPSPNFLAISLSFSFSANLLRSLSSFPLHLFPKSSSSSNKLAALLPVIPNALGATKNFELVARSYCAPSINKPSSLNCSPPLPRLEPPPKKPVLALFLPPGANGDVIVLTSIRPLLTFSTCLSTCQSQNSVLRLSTQLLHTFPSRLTLLQNPKSLLVPTSSTVSSLELSTREKRPVSVLEGRGGMIEGFRIATTVPGVSFQKRVKAVVKR